MKLINYIYIFRVISSKTKANKNRLIINGSIITIDYRPKSSSTIINL